VTRHAVMMRRRGEGLLVKSTAIRASGLMRAWCALALRIRHKAKLVALQVPFSARRTLRRAWRAIRICGDRLRTLEALGRACSARIRRNAALNALHSWGGVHEQKRLARRFTDSCAATIMLGRGLRALRRWHSEGTARAADKRRLKEACIHFQFRRELIATRHWSFWARREASTRRVARFVASRAVLALVHRCTAVWLAAHLRRRLLRALGSRGVVLSAARRTSAALTRWRAVLRERRRQRKADGAAAAALLSITARRALRSWAAKGAAGGARRRFYRHAEASVIALRTALCVSRWRQYARASLDWRAAKVSKL
jgi:hypothetical protein